jgi:hypothetical protein
MDRRIVQQSRGGLPALTLDKMNHFVDTLKGTARLARVSGFLTEASSRQNDEWAQNQKRRRG